jgi:hypothetical protein
MTHDDFEPLEIADDAGDELVSIEDFVTYFCAGVVAPDALPIAPPLPRQWEADGWLPGAPPHVTPETLALDQAAAEEAGCPECRCHDVVLAPYHRGGRFRYAAGCPACLAEWEA